MILNKIGLQTIALFIVGVISATIIYLVCLSVYNTQNIFDINYIGYYLTESSYSYSTNSINRTDGISIINRVFKFSQDQKLFGLGLGAGEYNSFFSGNIYQKYGEMHYIWFLYAWVYLENGYIGLGMIILLFVSIFLFLLKRNNNSNIAKVSCGVLAASFILIFYNPALRNDSAYILYTIIGIAIKECGEKTYELVRYQN